VLQLNPVIVSVSIADLVADKTDAARSPASLRASASPR
jgi:hypothetical protein